MTRRAQLWLVTIVGMSLAGCARAPAEVASPSATTVVAAVSLPEGTTEIAHFSNSSQGGEETASFATPADWLVVWAYNCNPISNPDGFNDARVMDIALDGTSAAGVPLIDPIDSEQQVLAGTSYYHQAGTWSLSTLAGQCRWSALVASCPTACGRVATRAGVSTFSGLGNYESPEFHMSGPTSVALTYDCSAFDYGPVVSYGSRATVHVYKASDPTVEIDVTDGAIAASDVGMVPVQPGDHLDVYVAIEAECPWHLTVGPVASVHAASDPMPPPVPVMPATAAVAHPLFEETSSASLWTTPFATPHEWTVDYGFSCERYEDGPGIEINALPLLSAGPSLPGENSNGDVVKSSALTGHGSVTFQPSGTFELVVQVSSDGGCVWRVVVLR